MNDGGHFEILLLLLLFLVVLLPSRPTDVHVLLPTQPLYMLRKSFVICVIANDHKKSSVVLCLLY